jgi:hypothetical protein
MATLFGESDKPPLAAAAAEGARSAPKLVVGTLKNTSTEKTVIFIGWSLKTKTAN